MRRFAISHVVVGCLAAMLGGAASGRSGYRKSWSRIVFVSIHGWGAVKLVRGFETHRPLECAELPRCGRSFYGQQRYVTLTATPYKGWEFSGWARACRKSIGTAHKIGNGYSVRVDSAQANVQLSAAPAVGDEYFDADLTLTYTGPGSSIPLDHLDLNAEARLGRLYNGDHGGGCPASDLQPQLDVAGLELYFGSGTLNFVPATTWFAFH